MPEQATVSVKAAPAPRLQPIAAEPPKAAVGHRWLGSNWGQEVGGWRVIPAGLSLVALLTVLGFWIEPFVQRANLATLYTLAVLVTALRWGRRAAILSAASGTLLMVYYFVPPYRSLAATDIPYFITFAGLLAIGLLVSILTLAAREETSTARTQQAQTAALYSLTKSLVETEEGDLDQRVTLIVRHLIETFHRPIVLWLRQEEGLGVWFRSPELMEDETETKAAQWAFQNCRESGCGADTLPGVRLHYLPLKTWKEVVGVLGILADGPAQWLPRQDQQLLETFANQAALAITRAMLAREAQRAAVLLEADKLQKALLNSISHNLRTPLASITGVLNSLLEDGHLLDAGTQRELLSTAQDEARRLNQVLQNLLDMTRLEGGAVRVRTELHDAQDAVGAALRQLGPSARQHPIAIDLPRDLPLVPMDFTLIVQVLVNLLDNAFKYSPAGAPVEVGAGLEADSVQIRVADFGKGIPDQFLERVFDKFFRGASAESPGGAGLGLSICKGLVEAHRGRIWARRRIQGGTEFVFSLPLETKH